MTSRTRISPCLAATLLAMLIPGHAGAQIHANPALASSAPVEQTAHGPRPALPILDAFDGLGVDRHAGDAPPRNPSDNSLAVGPDHLVQTVNSQIAVFTKRGARFETSGRPLFGPVATNAVFAGHGEVCGSRANGDAVVRYDQLAGRWLVVMPIFRRAVPPASGAGAGRSARRRRPAWSGLRPRPAGRARRRRRRPPARVHRKTAATPSATRSAPAPIPSAPITATSSRARCSPTTRARRCGPTATTCRPAPATR